MWRKVKRRKDELSSIGPVCYLAKQEGREKIRRPLARVLEVINYPSRYILSTPHTSTETQL